MAIQRVAGSSRGTVGWCSSPTTTDRAGLFDDVGQVGSLCQCRAPARGWSQTLQTGCARLQARTMATLGAGWCQTRTAVCSGWIVASREVEHGVAAGSGERRHESVPKHGNQLGAQKHERPDPHRVGCLPAGILGRERPPMARGRAWENTHGPAPLPSYWTGGSLPGPLSWPVCHGWTRRAEPQDVAAPSHEREVWCATPDGESAHRPPTSFAQSSTAVSRALLAGWRVCSGGALDLSRSTHWESIYWPPVRGTARDPAPPLDD